MIVSGLAFSSQDSHSSQDSSKQSLLPRESRQSLQPGQYRQFRQSLQPGQFRQSLQPDDPATLLSNMLRIWTNIITANAKYMLLDNKAQYDIKVSHNSAVITWYGTTATSYIFLVNGAKTTATSSNYTSSPRTATLSGLRPSTSYDIVIVATNDGGTTPSSRPFNGLVLWLDAADPGVTLTNGQTLTTWYDKSGYNNHGTGTVTYQTAGINGLPAFALTGSQAISGNIRISTNQLTVFAVYVMNDNSDANARLVSLGQTGQNDTTNNNYLAFTRADKGFRPNRNGTQTASNSPASYSSAYLTETWFDGSNAYATVQNGPTTSIVQTPSSGPFNISKYSLGASLQEAATTYLNGKLAEVLIYDSVLNQEDRQKIEGYLSWKWGIQTNLPASNPYSAGAGAVAGPVFGQVLITPPALPANVNITSSAPDEITVTWTSDISAISYNITVSDPNGNIRTYTGVTSPSPVSPVSAGLTYSVVVIAVNGPRTSSAAPVTFRIGPEPASGIDLLNPTINGFTIIWTAGEDAVGYKISIGGGAFTSIGNVLTYPFSSLSPGTPYQIVIKSIDSNGVEIESPAFTARTLTLPPSPNYSDVTISTYTVNWSAITGAVSYSIKIDSNDYILLGTATTYSMFGLTAGSSDTVTVRATNASNFSNASNPLTIVTTPPAPPNFVKIGVATFSSINVSWDLATGATLYYLSSGAGYDFPTASTTFEYTNLSGGTTYILTVKAYNVTGGYSVPSESLSVLTRPNPVTGLDASNITDTTCDLFWNKVTGATSYSIKVGSGNFQLVTQGDEGTSYTYPVTGLSPGTTTIITVQSTNAAGSTEATLSVLTAPAAPILSYSDITIDGFKVSWTGATGASSYSYALTLNSQPVSATQTVEFTGPSGSITYSGLLSSTSYEVVITAKNISGDTPSSPLSVSTAAPPIPTAPILSSSNITTTGFTVTWTGATGAASYSYALTVPSGASEGGYTTTVNGTSGTVIWTGLTPAAEYSVVISAINGGYSTPSSSLSVTTATPLPTQPILSLYSFTNTTFTISWTGGLYADIYTYKINGNLQNADPDEGLSLKRATFSGSFNIPYTVEVIATNATGPTTSGNMFTVTIPAPPNITSSNITNTGFTVNWTGTFGAVTFTYRLNGNLTTPSSSGDNGSQYYATFTGLLSTFKYSVIVFATNAFGTVSSSPYLPQTADNILNLDAFDVDGVGTTTTFSNNTAIASWDDKTDISGGATVYSSGGGNCFYSISANNGYPAIGLNSSGLGSYLDGNISITGNQITIFTVINISSSAGYGARILSFPNQSRNGDYQHDDAMLFERSQLSTRVGVYRNGPEAYPADDLTYDAMYLHSCVVDGSTMRVQSYNGNQNNFVSTAHNKGNFNIPAYSIGSQYTTNRDQFFAGYICEIIIYDIALTQQQRYEVEGYLSWKWGLQEKLYNSHPYKNKGLQVTTINPSGAPILSPSNITYFGFTVDWTGATGADSYSYALTVPPGAVEGTYIPTVNGTSGSVTWSGLTALSEYSVVITSINSSGFAPSTALSVTTSPPPPIISSSNITSTGFTINWTGTFGAATFTYRLNGNLRTPSSSVVNGADYYATFSGLLSSFEYSVIVLATANFSSTESSSLQVTTLAPPLAPILSPSNITETGFTVTWTGATRATSYSYALTVPSGAVEGSYQTSVNGASGTVVWIGLTPSSQYSVVISAINGDYSAPSSSLPVTTATPFPTQPIISLYGFTNTTFTISWTGGLYADGYTYKINGTLQNADPDEGLSLKRATFSGSFNIPYTVEVIATNATGPTSSGNIFTVTIPAPPNLTSSNITNNMFTINWTGTFNVSTFTYSLNGNLTTPSPSGQNFATFTGLSPSSEYSVIVFVTNEFGTVSSSIQVTTRLNLLPPTGLDTSQVTSFSFILIWTQATGATSYKISIDGGQTYPYSSVITEVEINNLSEDTPYTVCVQSAIDNYFSSPSENFIVTTLAVPYIITSTSNIYAWSVASSASGQYLTTGIGSDQGGYILISSDYGSTFYRKLPNPPPYKVQQPWLGFACDSTGQYQLATSGGNAIAGTYYSTNYGNSWTHSPSGLISCRGVGMSGTGQYALSGQRGGDLVRSSNYGITWTITGLANTFWERFVLSSTGQYQVASVEQTGVGIYISSDYGSTWTNRLAGVGRFNGLACDSTGQKIIVGDTTPGFIYISTNAGQSWTPSTSLGPGFWFNIACDSTGTYIVTTNSDPKDRYPMYRSTDGGTTWIPFPALFYDIYSYATSADGSKVFGGTLGARLYRSTDYGATYVTL